MTQGIDEAMLIHAMGLVAGFGAGFAFSKLVGCKIG